MKELKILLLMLFRMTLKDMRLMAMSITVVARRSRKLMGLLATNTATINRVARIIFVLGSSLCISDLPGKNWPRVISEIIFYPPLRIRELPPSRP